MRQAHQHGRARGAWLIAAMQSLACFDDGKGAAGFNAQGFEHFGCQNFSHRAFQGQAAIAEAAIGRLP